MGICWGIWRKKPKRKKSSKTPKGKENESSVKEDEPEEQLTLEQLQKENAKLKADLHDIKLKEINKEANKPSSKQAEWEAKGVGNDQTGSRRKKRKKNQSCRSVRLNLSI